MQAGRPRSKQFRTHFGDHFLTKLADAVTVIAVGFQLLADPAGNFRAAHVREAGQVGEVDDGHNTRHHRNGDAHLLQAVDEVEVAVRVEEVLSDGAVGTGFDLAGEILQVVFRGAGLGMKLRVGRYFNIEGIAAVLANKFHQLIGVTQFTSSAHAGWHVASQGDDPVDAVVAVHVQQLRDAVASGAHAGQVRRGGNAPFVKVQHRLHGAIPGGAAGTEGDREEIRINLGQGIAHTLQFFPTLVGLGWEKLKAEAAFELFLGFHVAT